MMNYDEFCEYLRHRKSTQPPALFIGLDGTHLLMGHRTPEEMIRDIAPEYQTAHRQIQDFRSKYGDLDDAHRQKCLGDWFEVTDPDEECLGYLVRMLQEGFLRAVLATDPHQHLFMRIRQAIPARQLVRLDCAAVQDSAFNAMCARGAQGATLFLDGGDVIWRVTRSYLGFDSEGINARRRRIQSYFSRLLFPEVCCWGWSAINTHIRDLRLEGGERVLYALGCVGDFDHSDGYTEDSGGDDLGQNHLREIGRRLFPDGGRGRAIRGTPDGRGDARLVPPESPLLRGPGSASPPPCLLWDTQILNGIAGYTARCVLTVVGVDGALVRARVGERVCATLADKGPWCFRRRHSNLEGTNALVGVLARGDVACQLVSELGEDGGATRGNHQLLREFLLQWAVKLGTKECRALMLVPRGWVDPQLRLEGVSDQIGAVALESTVCLSEANVTRWLREQLPEELAPDAASQLGRRMLETTGGPEAVDWLHEALDFWLARVRFEAGRSSQKPESEALLAECTRVWNQLIEDYRAAGRGVPDDFEIRVVPRRPQPPSGGNASPPVGDFDLGPVTPHRRQK